MKKKEEGNMLFHDDDGYDVYEPNGRDNAVVAKIIALVLILIGALSFCWLLNFSPTTETFASTTSVPTTPASTQVPVYTVAIGLEMDYGWAGSAVFDGSTLEFVPVPEGQQIPPACDVVHRVTRSDEVRGISIQAEVLDDGDVLLTATKDGDIVFQFQFSSIDRIWQIERGCGE